MGLSVRGLLFLVLFASSAYAALGETKSSAPGEVYAMRESVAGPNQIHEYTNSEGVVFAVTWHGISTPDLSTLLGSYFDEYQKAEKATPKRHGRVPRPIKGEHVVVEQGGHMRSIHGIAYVPSLVPAGVKVDELQ